MSAEQEYREVLEMLADDDTWMPRDPSAIPVRVRDIARAVLAKHQKPTTVEHPA